MGILVLMVALAACTKEVEVIEEVEVEKSTTSRLDVVKARGKVICASRNDVPGYGSLDATGNNVGFDIDLCRAVAAAVLGDPKGIEIRFISASERGPTIQFGEVDVLTRTVTWTTSRDASGEITSRPCSMMARGYQRVAIARALAMQPKILAIRRTYFRVGPGNE